MPLWSVRAVVAGGRRRPARGRAGGAAASGATASCGWSRSSSTPSRRPARPALLVVDGEAGRRQDPARLGVREVRRRAAARPSAGTAAGASPTARGWPTAPWPRPSAAGCRLLRRRRRRPATATRTRPRCSSAASTRYVPDADEREWLEPAARVPCSGSAPVGSFPREDLFAAWTTFLERVGADDDPVVLVIDDAQHADDGLLDVRGAPARGRRRSRASCVLLARPGPARGATRRWPRNRRATVLHLERPHRPATWRPCSTASWPACPTTVAGRAGRAGRGHPAVRRRDGALADRPRPRRAARRAVRAGGPRRLDLDAIGAPASLQALIAARLDALRPDAATARSTARSVLGDVVRRAR